VKVTLFSVAVILFVVAVGYRQAKATAEKTDSDIREVAEILEKATANAPPLPAGPPRGPWVDHVKKECARRERSLAGVRRPTGLDGIGLYTQRIVAIHRSHARRLSRVQAPERLLTERRRIDRINTQQLRILVRVARAARAGDLAAAGREARALRFLAGEANAELLRLGLTGCLLRPSGMPL
jgi:hypothetical protein